MTQERGPVSIEQYYQRGLITKKERFALTVPVQEYLESIGATLRTQYFSVLASKIGNDGIVKISNSGKRGSYHLVYRADADVLNAKRDEIKDVIQEIKTDSLPKRSNQEIAEAKVRVLQLSDGNGGVRMLSFEEAYEILFNYGTSRLEQLRHDDAEGLAQTAIMNALPYLEGQRGSFRDFEHFSRFFNKVLKNVGIDQFRQESKEKKKIAKKAIEQVGSTEFEKETGSEVKAVDLNLLSDRERAVYQLRETGLKNSQIARVLGITENAVKGRFREIRWKIRNSSTKRPR